MNRVGWSRLAVIAMSGENEEDSAAKKRHRRDWLPGYRFRYACTRFDRFYATPEGESLVGLAKLLGQVAAIKASSRPSSQLLRDFPNMWQSGY